MEIGRRSAGEVTVVSLSGEFDAKSMDAVRDAVEEIREEGCTRLVMNLSALRFLNSPAITFLIQTAKELDGVGGKLVLSQLSSFLEGKMETLGLERVFGVFPDDDAAITHLGSV